ncbi:MAG: hypothetical protein HC921_14440 [Synechococcaceae cyanobacterium SM2_3_1]|nr:hypothetical protein [Synechococcaceae cyanobacterium SM2_3_1]
MASELLQGQIGTSTPPPGWLSEYVFRDGRYYFVFPLGSILTMLPVALLDRLGILSGPSSVLIASLIAGGLSCFGFLLAQAYRFSLGMQVSLVIFLTLGNWIWCNLVFGYADMLTLGWSALGQLGSLYFVLGQKQPLISGLLFALAIGNRTEVIVLTPIFMALWFILETDSKRWLVSLYRFCFFPILILLLTFCHNYFRFNSIFEFGKGLVPGIFEQPHFASGLYSIAAIPDHFTEMLTATWQRINHFPFVAPSGFGGSIFLASPFLVLLFRFRAMNQPVVILSWIAMIVMTFTMWLYGDVGGWQFSYRYAVNLLPWIYILLLYNAPRQINIPVICLLLISLLINIYAVWLFHWTTYL